MVSYNKRVQQRQAAKCCPLRVVLTRCPRIEAAATRKLKPQPLCVVLTRHAQKLQRLIQTYHQQRREAIRASFRKYNQQHHEVILAQDRRQHQQNQTNSRAWYREHREEGLAKKRACYLRNRDNLLAKKRRKPPQHLVPSVNRSCNRFACLCGVVNSQPGPFSRIPRRWEPLGYWRHGTTGSRPPPAPTEPQAKDIFSSSSSEDEDIDQMAQELDSLIEPLPPRACRRACRRPSSEKTVSNKEEEDAASHIRRAARGRVRAARRHHQQGTKRTVRAA